MLTLIQHVLTVIVVVGLPLLVTVLLFTRTDRPDQPHRRANDRYPLTRNLTK